MCNLKLFVMIILSVCAFVCAPAWAQQAQVPQIPEMVPMDMAVPGLPAPTVPQNALPVTMAPPMSTVSAKTAATANEIAEINERLAVLTARLAELELQARIAAKISEIDKVSKSPAEVMSPITSPETDTFVPSVKEISGVDGVLNASIYVQGGNTQVVRVGDRVGVWRVKDIQIDAVIVENNGQDMRLGFGAYTPTPSGSSSGSRAVPPSMPGQR